MRFNHKMEKKTLKFTDILAQMILRGEKDLTWRLFDDKNLQIGDEIDLVNFKTGEKFGEGTLIEVREKTLSTLTDEDFDGHEKFASEEEMYETYRGYYGDRVNPDSPLKIIRFTFTKASV